jgi:protein-L-isoaspartate O-methyltransferase
MIEDQLKKCGIKDPKVLLAMEMVPREMFLAEDMALFA